MKHIKRIAKQTLNAVLVTVIHVVRYVHYWMADRSPVLLTLDVSDRVLVNNRISYSCENVTHVQVKGIVRSHLHTNVLILEVPKGMSVVEIVFQGVQEEIAERVTLTFLSAEFQKANLKKSLRRPVRLILRGVSATLTSFKTFHVVKSFSRFPRKAPQVQKRRLNVNITYPQIDKSTSL